MSTYINNKLFTYVNTYENSKTHASTIAANYPNSLVFIGDERIIWQPLTNSYVGIGQSAYSYIVSQLDILKEATGTTAAIPHVDVLYSQKDNTYIATSKIDGTNNGVRLTTSDVDLAYFEALSNSMNLNIDGLKDKLNTDLSYLKEFAVANTNKQIDTLYQVLLGSEDSNDYVEHELDHFIDKETGEVFNKDIAMFIDSDGTGGPETQVYLSYEAGVYSIKKSSDDTSVQDFTMASNGAITIVDSNGPSGPADGVEQIGNVYTYILYTQPAGSTNSYGGWSGTQITEGIDTIKEIAYILDKITDGDTSGISLAYNIADLNTKVDEETENRKADDEAIRREMVKGVTVTGDDYINVVEFNSYSYNGLKTGVITTGLSLNVAEVDQNQVGWIDGNGNYNWIYEDTATYTGVTPTIELFDTPLDQETLLYYYDNQITTNPYIVYHSSTSGWTQTPGSTLYVKNGDQMQTTTSPSAAFIEVINTKDKYEYNGGKLSNGDKLLTTVDWVSAYIAPFYQEFKNLNTNSDIYSYITNTDYLGRSTYNMPVSTAAQGDPEYHTYTSIITSITPKIYDDNGKAMIGADVTYSPILKSEISYIQIVEQSASDTNFYSYNNSYLSGTGDYSIPFTKFEVTLSYLKLENTLVDGTSLTNAQINDKDGFASAHDVSETLTDMFSWYDLSTGTEALYGS